MERRLVVGIRDLCILSSRKACLDGNKKEKTDKRSTICVDGSPKNDSLCRVDQMRTIHGFFFFFVCSTPHCTLCPARWLVSSLSVCNPSSDQFVKSHRWPSSFTNCNIFCGFHFLRLNKKDFLVSFQNFKLSKRRFWYDHVIKFCVLNHVSLQSFTPGNLKSISWAEVVKLTHQNSHMENLNVLFFLLSNCYCSCCISKLCLSVKSEG